MINPTRPQLAGNISIFTYKITIAFFLYFLQSSGISAGPKSYDLGRTSICIHRFRFSSTIRPFRGHFCTGLPRFQKVPQSGERIPEAFAMLRQAFAMLRQVFAMLRQVFAMLRQVFTMLRQVFAMLRQVFVMLRQVFTMLRQFFAMLRRLFANVAKIVCDVVSAFGIVVILR